VVATAAAVVGAIPVVAATADAAARAGNAGRSFGQGFCLIRWAAAWSPRRPELLAALPFQE
jgi:hypothetical protein